MEEYTLIKPRKNLKIFLATGVRALVVILKQ